MTTSSMTSAIVAANHAFDIIMGRLQADLGSMDEQIDELEIMSKHETMTPQDRTTLNRLKRRVKALNKGCSDTISST